ncbi:pentapeptide repeat-containing protein [Anaerolinea sp.]|uniref:pentapeptide repeat-containing protein n=1 Tax=Anaerolinea sp. TaxID=1872519 RepID=UPI002ACDCCC8|nr:pentapeptide repeat-containing protein [Anaerolinea sp.]
MLDILLEKHRKWLNGEPEPDGQQLILMFNNLDRVNFRNADLRKARIIGCSMKHCNFSDTNLSEADLSGTSFDYSNFRNAILENAEISQTTFNHADLSYTDLRVRPSKKVEFCSATMQNTNMRGIQLENANFSYAQMESAVLENAELTKDVSFWECNLVNSQWQGAKLIGAIVLDFADLRNANLDNVAIKGISAGMRIQAKRTIFQNTSMKNMEIELFVGEEVNFSGANLSGAVIRNSYLRNSEFRYAILVGTTLNGVEFHLCNFTGTVFSMCRTEKTLFEPLDPLQISNSPFQSIG